jgi:hypothetical protein
MPHDFAKLKSEKQIANNKHDLFQFNKSNNCSLSLNSSLSPTKTSKSGHSKSSINTVRTPGSYEAAATAASSSSNSVATGAAHLPSKDSVIKKMKKITKTVQDLFKATKLSDFSS